jgi:hypothetical protein
MISGIALLVLLFNITLWFYGLNTRDNLCLVYWVNWKYAITIFKDWRSAIKNRLIGNLPLQFNHMPKLVIAIQSDIGNLPLQFGAILEICHSISASA